MNNLFYRNILPVYNTFIDPAEEDSYIPENFLNITEEVLKKINWNKNIETYENKFEIDNIEENNKVMVGLSAGLDSAYLVAKLLEDGNDVIAVHIKNLNNMSKAEEYESAKKIAEILKIKFISIEMNSPKQFFADNPFKNQLILSLMLDYGIKCGCYRFALGSDWTTPLSDGAVGLSITDTSEVYQEFWKDVQTHWKQAELIFIEDNIKKKDRIEYLFNNNIEVFKNLSSCVMPHRFKKFRKRKTEEKFNLKLYENRCGSCYKCCMEYLLLCELKLVDKNLDYYNYCWNRLSECQYSYRPDLWDKNIPLDERVQNLLDYGS